MLLLPAVNSVFERKSVMNRNSTRVGLIFLVITIMLFSTFEVTSKYLAPYMEPTQITFTRFLVGGLVLLPLTMIRMKRKHVHPELKDIMSWIVLGFINVVVSMGLIQLGLVYANASVSAALFSINPLFVLVFARFLLHERITGNKILALILGIAGIIILSLDSIRHKTATLGGLLLILGAAVCFALYTVLGKKLIHGQTDSLIITTFSFLAGSLFMIPLEGVLGVPLFPNIAPVIPQFLYMAVAVTGIAYVLYFEGLSRLEAGAGTMLYFAKPALASVIAVMLLGESISFSLILGIAVIACGIFLSQSSFSARHTSHHGLQVD
jgi:drug/metabolite transporter (DMT)-like permease